MFVAGDLLFYLDMHAHAHTRGCVLYGNRLPASLSQADFLALQMRSRRSLGLERDLREVLRSERPTLRLRRLRIPAER